MKDVTNNFLEKIEPVYTPGTINFDFDKFDAAIQAAVSELWNIVTSRKKSLAIKGLTTS